MGVLTGDCSKKSREKKMEKEVGNRETAVVVVVMVKVRGNLLWSASHLTTQKHRVHPPSLDQNCLKCLPKQTHLTQKNSQFVELFASNGLNRKGEASKHCQAKKNNKKPNFVLRREGVEPPPTGWKPVILPLNYRRILFFCFHFDRTSLN